METQKIKFLKPNVFDLGEDWENYYVKIKDVRKNDIFYECEKNSNFELKALEDAKKVEEGWAALVQNTSGKTCEIYFSDKTNWHGPNIFWAPQFISSDEEKGVGYEVI